MSCVIVIALPPTVLTAVIISLSIKLPVTGSKPDVGSSNNKIFGLPQIALAIAILFCIPPDISDGYRFKIFGSKPRFLIIERAKISAFLFDNFSLFLTLKTIFSQFLSESKSAPC